MKIKRYNRFIVALAAGIALAVLFFAVFVPSKPAPIAAAKSEAHPPQAQRAFAPQSPPQPSALPQPPASNAAVASARTTGSLPPPPTAKKLTLNDGGMDRAFSIAMDELVQKTPAGIEKTVSIPIQSDLAGLREKWNALQSQGGGEVLLVAYEDGAARNAKTRRLVTPTIRVELGRGQTLAQAIPGAVAVTQPDYAPGFVIAKMPDSFAAMDALASVRSLGGVARADVLLARQQSRRSLPNDPLIPWQWHLKNTGQSIGVPGADINVEPIWNFPGRGYRGAGVVVALIDDGLQTAHPDLQANVRTDIDHDWNDGTPDDPNPAPGDENSHGTSCAGNVAAIANNAVGVSGSAPEAQVVGLRLIADFEGDQEEAEAMAWRNDVIQIKSNSWGPNDDGLTLEGPGSLTKAAFKTSTTSGRGGLGTIFLWAGGNGRDSLDNANYDGYANSIYTIAIGAVTSSRRQSWYSESGANLVASAPSSGDTDAGELDITTIDRTGTDGYNTKSGVAGNYAFDFGGTSSASPTAAGVVALMLQRNPKLGWRDVQEILIKTAAQINPLDLEWTTNAAGYHFSHKFGAGLIDATAAVKASAGWKNLGAQTSVSSAQTGLPVTIPDNNATGITRTFNLGASKLRVEHVTVRLTIKHQYRGDLDITLTSPTGVPSKLAELHDDTGDDFADWTFMTTRDWGERSAGVWTLKIADRYSGGIGTLNAAELTVFGAALPAGNPPPVVRLTKTSMAAGSAIKLAAVASDRTAAGTAGRIARVDFYADGILVGSDNAAPYSLQWKPAGGVYVLTARATDGEGAVGSSATTTAKVGGASSSGPKLQITKQTLASRGKVLVVRGTATGSPPLRVSVKNRHALKSMGVRSGAAFNMRIRLRSGVNTITLKATDSNGALSNSVRILRTRK